MINPVSSIENKSSNQVLEKSKERNNARTKLLSDILKAELDTAEAEKNKQIIHNDKEKKSESTKKLDYTALEDKLKEIMKEDDVDIKIDKDDTTNQMVLRLIDKETKETIKQYPPEITLKIARMVSDFMDHGAITDATA